MVDFRRLGHIWYTLVSILCYVIKHLFFGSDRYKVFVDLFNLATFLLPLEFRPPLPVAMERKLNIHLSGSAVKDAEELSKRMRELKTMGEQAKAMMEREQCNSPELVGTSV